MVKETSQSASEEHSARAIGRSLPISTKHVVEICSFIRGKSVEEAKKLLEGVIGKKVAVPFKRYNKDVGHKKGMSTGRYPVKAASEILRVIKSAEANAQFKGINTSNLIVKEAIANKASTPLHFGRSRGRRMKRTHVSVKVEEVAKSEIAGKENKTSKKKDKAESNKSKEGKQK